jgi:uncharacterized protein YnzC (UPF0291/DUF896 family)
LVSIRGSVKAHFNSLKIVDRSTNRKTANARDAVTDIRF